MALAIAEALIVASGIGALSGADSIAASETGALAGVALTGAGAEAGAEAAGGTPDGGAPADGITGDGMADGAGADITRHGGEAIHTLYSSR